MATLPTSAPTRVSRISLLVAPLIFILVCFFVDLSPGKPVVTYTFAVALLMAIWWITEAIPLAVTSLLPIFLFPLLGIMNGKAVSSIYFNHVIFLFIGGFLVALAMQRWNLHKRIALRVLILVGMRPGSILFGFMFATAFLSMWISNTATAMMMVPIVISVLHKMEDSVDSQDLKRFSIGLLLGVAYGASIGGIATLVGTPPNLSFVRIFSIIFPDAPEISFTSWFIFAIPVSAILFFVVWLFLLKMYQPKGKWKKLSSEVFRKQYRDLGQVTFEEKAIFIVFVSLALLWLTRSKLEIGSFLFPGWASLFPNPSYINDGTVAVAMGVILFLIPAKNKNTQIMNWQTATQIPWHIILLFGGGFALASGFKESGLSLWFGGQLQWVGTLHPIIVIASIAFLLTFLTELTSNTATTEMLLPVLAGLAITIQVNPLLFMIPATLSGSLAFMLPVATPPNAIVFGTNRLRIIDMARTGLILNLIGVVVVTLVSYYWGMYIFDIDVSQFPEWANVAGE